MRIMTTLVPHHLARTVMSRRSTETFASALTGVAAWIFLVTGALAADPETPPGNDPGGQAIAIISTGVDYTDKSIAARLARDGEGALIGWDFVDNDHLPYPNTGEAVGSEAGASGTALAKLALKVYAKSRLVAVRVNPGNSESLMRAFAFVARTPARIVIVPFWSTQASDWAGFQQAAAKLTDHLFIVPGGSAAVRTAGQPVYPATLRLSNVVAAAPAQSATLAQLEPGATPAAVDAWVIPRGSSMFSGIGGPPRTSAEAAALIGGVAACAQHNRKDVASGAEMKAALLALARSVKGNAALRVHDPMCLYGGKRY